MRTVYRLPFRLLGIPIRLDLTFLLILPLLAWLIGSELGRLREAFALEPGAGVSQSGLAPYLLGLVCALGLFLSVLVHELGHSLVGQRFNLRIRHITLWILGGMAEFERIPRNRGTEALMAFAGPVTSTIIGLVAGLLLRLTPQDLPNLQFFLAYLMYMNLALAAFNLLPALPLDGGRVFRSLLAIYFSFTRATQIAASMSKLLAILLGLIGLFFLNFWLILMAFFIFVAVTGETQQVTVSTMLRGIRVHDLMTRHVETVPPDLSVSDLIQRMFQQRHLAYPVMAADGRVVGIVTLQHIRHAKASHRESEMRVSEIMSETVGEIEEHETALVAFHRISRTESGRLLVVDRDGRLRGIISKTDLVRAIQVRTVEAGFDGSDES